MAKLGDIIEEAQSIMQDSSIDTVKIKVLVNAGLEEAAGYTSAPLPHLEKTKEVATRLSSPFLMLPDDYHRELYFCYDTTGNREAKILKSLELLTMKFPKLNQAGNVFYAAVSGNRLYYQSIPSTIHVLRIHYFQKPVLLVENKDVPECLPSHLQRKLLVNYACKELFSPIEDGIEGPKVNTSYHDRKWEEALNALELWNGPRESRSIDINDVVTGAFD